VAFLRAQQFQFLAKFLACFALLANSCFFSLFIWRYCWSFLAKLVAGTTSGLFLTVWSAAYLVQVLKAHFEQFLRNQLFLPESCKIWKAFFLLLSASWFLFSFVFL